ncbi:hypothetical protein ACLMJK_004018 [Lecanora helva]
MEKAAKEALFKELHDLDKDDLEQKQTSSADIPLSKSRHFMTELPSTAGAPQSFLTRRTNTDQPSSGTKSKTYLTHHGKAGSSSGISSSTLGTSLQQTQEDAPTIKGSSFSTTDKKMSKTTGKRKREQPVVTKPEAQQIFKGLSFFFIPNNDISPTRKFRIRKAMEFGARWVREWQGGISHVMVDNHVCYDDVLKFLEISSLPAGVTLVNDIWAPDCLTYGFLVNPDQAYYKLKGQIATSIPQQSSATTEGSEKSLQVKPERTRSHMQPSPSNVEPSEQRPLSQPPHEEVNLSKAGPRKTEEPSSLTHSGSALDEAIEEAKAIQDLPLEPEDDDSRDSTHDMEDLENFSNDDEPKAKRKVKKGSSGNAWQENFSCMSKHDGTSKAENPNAKTIEILQRMGDYYERTQDHWRLTAYRRAIAALRKQDRKITTAKEAYSIPFIGQRLADKIEEIVWTNRLRRLENANWEPNDEILQSFMKIYGVGLKQATKWIDQGHRTIADLVNKASLTTNQKIGIEHFDDFQTRIPRHEMDRHDRFVRDFCRKIDPTIELIIGGSYRRGAADSGDIDFIVTKPDCPLSELRRTMLETMIPRLFKEGYLRAGLATTAKDDGSKWHGAAALPGETIWRRIDFLFVPSEEIGAALIYFTGNDIFNRSIRLLASKKGMRLNQRGLWKDVIRGPSREKITQGSLVEGKDEHKIFEHLGIPWRPPAHREHDRENAIYSWTYQDLEDPDEAQELAYVLTFKARDIFKTFEVVVYYVDVVPYEHREEDQLRAHGRIQEVDKSDAGSVSSADRNAHRVPSSEPTSRSEPKPHRTSPQVKAKVSDDYHNRSGKIGTASPAKARNTHGSSPDKNVHWKSGRSPSPIPRPKPRSERKAQETRSYAQERDNGHSRTTNKAPDPRPKGKSTHSQAKARDDRHSKTMNGGPVPHAAPRGKQRASAAKDDGMPYHGAPMMEPSNDAYDDRRHHQRYHDRAWDAGPDDRHDDHRHHHTHRHHHHHHHSSHHDNDNHGRSSNSHHDRDSTPPRLADGKIPRAIAEGRQTETEWACDMLERTKLDPNDGKLFSRMRRHPWEWFFQLSNRDQERYIWKAYGREGTREDREEYEWFRDACQDGYERGGTWKRRWGLEGRSCLV